MNLEYLKQSRLAKGYNQTQAAENIGISMQMYQYIEQGRRSGTIDTIAKICKALDMDANILLNLKQRG